MKKTLNKIEFQLQAMPGKRVAVAGTFNNWDPTKNPMKDNPDSGHYKAVIAVPPGKYEYKFVIDGEWVVDPNCPAWVQNSHGSLNSIVNVQG